MGLWGAVVCRITVGGLVGPFQPAQGPLYVAERGAHEPKVPSSVGNPKNFRVVREHLSILLAPAR
jgi:hypothetical protein